MVMNHGNLMQSKILIKIEIKHFAPHLLYEKLNIDFQ